jgi:hypothetical protein
MRFLQSFSNPPLDSSVLAPVKTEVYSRELSVDGQVPKELHGLYIRTGPNPQFQPAGGYHVYVSLLYSIVLVKETIAFRGDLAEGSSSGAVQRMKT